MNYQKFGSQPHQEILCQRMKCSTQTLKYSWFPWNDLSLLRGETQQGGGVVQHARRPKWDFEQCRR
jgi:hypothetical protein